MKAEMEIVGPRHAMGKAHSYGHLACAMYDETTDSEVLEMKLNRSLLSQQKRDNW